MSIARRIGCLALLVCVVVASTASARGADGSKPALDLRSVDWSSVTLPAVCGGSKQIKLHRPSSAVDRSEGTADVAPIPHRWSDDSFYGRHSVEVDTGGVIYGDLGGVGHSDTALRFDCNNGGGTADGALLIGYVIFSGADGRLSVVGVVTPRVQPARELPTLVEIAMAPGKITAREFVYGQFDGTCCPSGRATTIWTYANGHLRPTSTTITRRPATSPPKLSRCQLRH